MFFSQFHLIRYHKIEGKYTLQNQKLLDSVFHLGMGN